MKKINIILLFLLLSFNAFCQLEVKKINGGSVNTNLGMGIRVNEGSSLNREFIVINDPNCPLQLNDVGVITTFSEDYSFTPIGTISPKEPITAYQIHHVLYNVFGEHMLTLQSQYVKDINEVSNFSRFAGWNASGNDIREYYTCVSYVSKVRTAKNIIWQYDFNDVKNEINKVKLKFDESYESPKLKDEKK